MNKAGIDSVRLFPAEIRAGSVIPLMLYLCKRLPSRSFFQLSFPLSSRTILTKSYFSNMTVKEQLLIAQIYPEYLIFPLTFSQDSVNLDSEGFKEVEQKSREASLL